LVRIQLLVKELEHIFCFHVSPPGDLDLDPTMPKNNRVLPYIIMTNISCKVLKNFTQWNLSYHLEMKLWTMDRQCDYYRAPTSSDAGALIKGT
jgi:hypothetical protein